MLLRPLPNLEIQKNYRNRSKFIGVYSRNNLSKIKDMVCIIRFSDSKSIGSHWIALLFEW